MSESERIEFLESVIHSQMDFLRKSLELNGKLLKERDGLRDALSFYACNCPEGHDCGREHCGGMAATTLKKVKA